MSELRGVVVVGAALAGLRAAEALRREGFTGTLTIVGDESEMPYDRPPLTKEMLRGEFADDELKLAGRGGAPHRAYRRHCRGRRRRSPRDPLHAYLRVVGLDGVVAAGDVLVGGVAYGMARPLAAVRIKLANAGVRLPASVA